MRTTIGVVLTAAIGLGAPAGTAWAAPGAPGAQLTAAEAAADAAATRIGELSARLTAALTVIADARASAAIALDEYQAKQAAYEAAQSAAQRAAAEALQAAGDLQLSRDRLTEFARSSYIDGSSSPGAASLIAADGPAELLERAALLEAAGAHRSDELGRFALAQARADRAEADAEQELAAAAGLQQQAAAALASAQTAERAARAQATDLASQQTQLQAELDQAQAQLVALVGPQRAADRIARQRAAAEAAASAAVAAAAGSESVVRTEAGAGSTAAARIAIDAARVWLGTAYSWGGGGSAGPSHGIDLDVAVVGFDCSGLTQYAYARAGIAIPRNSRAQFARLPKVARADLRAGDLVFWANRPSDPGTIHHVAIWLGDGTVLQAPESGDVVKVSPMWWAGYAGAVRPSA